MRPTILASVRFLAAAEGGRAQPVWSKGYRPHLVVDDGKQRGADGEYLGVCFVEPDREMVPGVSHEVRLQLMYSGVDYRALVPGASFTIREGGRVVGCGTVTERYEP